MALVVAHSASDTPALYRITAAWGNHEGSLLLWCLILGFYGCLLARTPPSPLKETSLTIHAIFILLFLSLLLFYSNPFGRLSPPALEGHGLNPLLQHPALALHPPFLYGGYVGLSAVASLAWAALCHPAAASHAIYLMRPLALLAWSSLTIGIALGAWWAYHELGWGGFWFWDPVENASFIPWCAATALIHSLATKNESHIRWILPLAISSFALAIIGTFLVRSGLITSVHAFASDPHRGIAILIILAVYSVSAIILYNKQSPLLTAGKMPAPASRHFMMIVQSILLFALAISVLLGTLYPILTAGAVSVGPPYYIYSLAWLGIPIALMMGVAPHMQWHKMSFIQPAISHFHLRLALFVAIASAVMVIIFTHKDVIIAVIGIATAMWILSATLTPLMHRSTRNYRSLAMLLAHSGLALVILSATAASVWQEEKIQFQKIGDTVALSHWDFQLDDVTDVWQDNYIAKRSAIIATDEDGNHLYLTPERRFYPERRIITTEAAVYSGWLNDIYIAFSEPISEQEHGIWTTRYWIKPLILWLWIGAALMAMGGIVAFLNQISTSQRRAKK